MKRLGVDGCRGGWFTAWSDRGSWDFALYADFGLLWDAHRDAECILVDMPIGLARDAVRRADVEVRKRLGPRRSSVFNCPVRAAVHAPDKATAKALNRKAVGKSLSEQSLNIMKKIREIDLFLSSHPEAQDRLFESHPELCFAMAAGGPLTHPKRKAAGAAERCEVLGRFVPEPAGLVARVREAYPASRVAGDDVLDALMLAVTAGGGAANLRPVPDPVEKDETGLPMAVWYREFDNA
jgi:predicted RNase H-like nuclease